MINSMSVNLMVADIVASLRFYTEVLGAELAFTVDAAQNTTMPGAIDDEVVFASVRLGDSEMMLQRRSSLIEDSPVFDESTTIGASATFYLRVGDVDAVAARIPESAEVIKPLETTWYGMREVWLRDPDGYVLTVGMPDGAPPAVN